MKIVRISQSSPDPSVVSEVVRLLKTGSVIAYPTDTFYGLGADIYNNDAVERIYSIKSRRTDKPIIILISDKKMLRPLIANGQMSHIAERLTDTYWPGPLTLVFNASDAVPAMLTANTGKVGIRLPDNELCRLLIEELKHPITATSANISGEGSIDNPADVAKSLGDMIDVLVDGGNTKGGCTSTVVDVTNVEPVFIREGVIPKSDILGVF